MIGDDQNGYILKKAAGELRDTRPHARACGGGGPRGSGPDTAGTQVTALIGCYFIEPHVSSNPSLADLPLTL